MTQEFTSDGEVESRELTEQLEQAVAALKQAQRNFDELAHAIQDEDWRGTPEGLSVEVFGHLKPYHESLLNQAARYSEEAGKAAETNRPAPIPDYEEVKRLRYLLDQEKTIRKAAIAANMTLHSELRKAEETFLLEAACRIDRMLGHVPEEERTRSKEAVLQPVLNDIKEGSVHE